MEFTTILAISIFVVTFGGIMTETVNKTVVVLCGGTAMVLLGVISQDTAFESVDLGVIFLLTGMMILVHFLGESGFFGYIAIRIAQLAKGRPIPLIILLCIVTGGLSALVDNVTTVLLMAPIILLITDRLEVPPIPFLLLTVFASNIGGAATLIGDPPNILIGSAAGLSFNAFLIHLAPISLLCMVAVAGYGVYLIRGHTFVSSDVRARVMELNARGAIRDKRLLVKTLSVLVVVLAAFTLHEPFGFEPASVTLAGAAVLLLITKADPQTAFRSVEWPTLFFFVGLFMLVAGLVATGLLEAVAMAGLRLSGSNLLIASLLIMWGAAIASALMDNVPVTTALIPVVATVIPRFAEASPYSEPVVEMALWWSLALGACFGGNALSFSAAANVVVVDIARSNQHPISFRTYFRASWPITLCSLILASLYVAWRYVL
ncbi:MAG: SLC13 family permease [Candidatus Hydrogenedentota bacterium]